MLTRSRARSLSRSQMTTTTSTHVKVKSCSLKIAHPPVQPTLSNLHTDMLSLVFDYLSVTDIYRVALTCGSLMGNVGVASMHLACDICDEDHLFNGVFDNHACGTHYARDCSQCEARGCRACVGDDSFCNDCNFELDAGYYSEAECADESFDEYDNEYYDESDVASVFVIGNGRDNERDNGMHDESDSDSGSDSVDDNGDGSDDDSDDEIE